MSQPIDRRDPSSLHSGSPDERRRPRRGIRIPSGDHALLQPKHLSELIAHLSLTLAGSRSASEALQECAAALVRHAEGTIARIWTLNHAEQVLELQASTARDARLDAAHERVALEETVIGAIARQRTPHLTNDLVEDPAAGDQQWARAQSLVAFAGYPLAAGEDLVGVLAMFARQPLAEADHQALATVARVIAFSLRRKLEEDALRLSEQALREKEERLRAALAASSTGTFRWDLRTNALDWDEILGGLFDLLPDQLPRHLHEFIGLVHPDDRQSLSEALERCVAEDCDLDLEFRIVWADGSVHWVLNRARMIREAGGRRHYMAGACVDITDRKVAEQQVLARAEELARLARALERSNRELDAFAYAASHDLRAPLRGIANLAQWIEEDLHNQGKLEEETREMLHLMRGRMHRMEALIEGLLQYSRAGRVQQKAERVDTKKVVREAIDLLSPPEAVAIHVSPDLPTLVTERLPLQQVFLNLVGNALKHARSHDAAVWVEGRSQGAFYEFAVRDNGPGIPPQYQERIWGIFQTLEARDTVEGTGIGLALVKKIVEAQGGRAWVESAPGAGATFRFLWRSG